MKRVVIFICIILVLITLVIPAFADESTALETKIDIEVNKINTSDGKVIVTSWPWLPLLQFERYRDLFE